MHEIRDGLPVRINIDAIVADARARLLAAGGLAPAAAADLKMGDVLREVALCAVEQFEGRTGERFTWTDSPRADRRTAALRAMAALHAGPARAKGARASSPLAADVVL
jgi:hypothetical protein